MKSIVIAMAVTISCAPHTAGPPAQETAAPPAPAPRSTSLPIWRMPTPPVPATTAATEATPTSPPPSAIEPPPTTTAPPTPRPTAAPASARRCFDPADYGARPTTSGTAPIDARAGIQGAIDAAGDASTVCLGPGVWHVSRAPLGSYDRFASLSIHGNRVSLIGSGPATVIAPYGDAGRGDWRVIDVTHARDVTISNLTIDTSELTNTDEQTHAIVATGPVDGLDVEGVSFYHPERKKPGGGVWRGGDCLRLVGAPGALVQHVSIVDDTFEMCDRSSIQVQTGVWGLSVIGSKFLWVGDTAIDSEPTSSAGNGDVIISGNQFADTNPLAQGAYAVTLAGFDQPEARVTVSDNVFARRGLETYRIRELTILGNTLSSGYAADSAVLSLTNVAEQWVVMGNTIHRIATAKPGAVVRAIHHGASKASTRGVLEGNVITQDTAFTVIDIESAQDLSVEGNDIAYTPSTTTWKNGFSAIALRATSFDADGILISNNRIRATTAGALDAAVALDANPRAFGAVSVTGNMSIGVDMGLRCEGRGGFTQPIVHTGNNWSGIGHPLSYSCGPNVATLVDSYAGARVTAPQVPAGAAAAPPAR